MASATTEPVYNQIFTPSYGMQVMLGDNIIRLTAPNPSHYTFCGTNTYIIGKDTAVVIDPGPNHPQHLDDIIAALAGKPLEAIILTHTHFDHCGNALALKERTGAPIYSGGPHEIYENSYFKINEDPINFGDSSLTPGIFISDSEMLKFKDFTLEAIATPGHCKNHFSFGLIGTAKLFSGDHVMGWNSTLISTPDGNLADYIKSLQLLLTHSYTQYLPGHGPIIKDGPAYSLQLLEHRFARVSQIEAEIETFARQLTEITSNIYQLHNTDMHDAHRTQAAQKSVQSHLEFLMEMNKVARITLDDEQYFQSLKSVEYPEM